MKISHIALLFAIASVSARFDKWSLNDIQYFLEDRGVEYGDRDHKALVGLAEEEFLRLKEENKDTNEGAVQHILNLVTGHGFKAPHKWDYLLDTTPHDDPTRIDTVKSWIFDSWSTAALKTFLNEYKIRYKKDARKTELVKTAKDNFDTISKKHESSGSYPGSWIYSTWSIDDLKKWLHDNDLTFDPKESAQELAQKVTNNNYLASIALSDSKKSLFDSLSLGEHLDVFDKAGKIKLAFVDTWTYSQLREWLYYQGLIDTKPGVQVDDLDKGKLKQIVLSNQDYLVDDIKSWSEQASKLASPYLEKGAEAVKDVSETAEEVINDTFLIGVEKWSKERLRSFLEARDVKIPAFATHSHLVNLVKTNKNIALGNKTVIKPANWILEDWSTEAIREWLLKKGQKVEGSRQDLVNKVNELISTQQQNFEDSAGKIQSRISAHKPNFDEYKSYATHSYHEANKNAKVNLKKAKKAASDAKGDVQDKYDESVSLADETILDAYNVGNEYYNTAAKLLSEKYARNQKKLEQSLAEAKKASYEYSSSFALGVSDKVGSVKPKFEQAVEAAKVDASAYATYVIDAFSATVEDGKVAAQEGRETVSSALFDYLYSAKQYFNKLVKPANAYASSAALVASNYGTAAQEYAASATDVAADYASDVREVVQNAYGQASGNDYSGFAQDAVNSVYSSVSGGWSSFWESISDADLKAYLRSFGYSSTFLNNITHDQLNRLAQQQTDFFFGISNKWDKPIAELLSEKLGFKKEKSTLEKVREAVAGK